MRICLAVQDETMNAALLALLRDAGHEPAIASNSSATLLRLGQDVFDVLMTDASCQDLHGSTILGFVKQTYPETWIVAVMWAQDPWREAHRSLADAMLAWPASINDVVQILNRRTA